MCLFIYIVFYNKAQFVDFCFSYYYINIITGRFKQDNLYHIFVNSVLIRAIYNTVIRILYIIDEGCNNKPDKSKKESNEVCN